MLTIFSDEAARNLKYRLTTLKPESGRQWGKMEVAQMLRHCQGPMEMAMGERPVKRGLLAKIIGPMIKKKFVKGDIQFSKNSPTTPDMKITAQHDFEEERDKLVSTLNRLIEKGKSGGLHDRHPFFGKMTDSDWGIMQYKHLDHHLRQFGV